MIPITRRREAISHWLHEGAYAKKEPCMLTLEVGNTRIVNVMARLLQLFFPPWFTREHATNSVSYVTLTHLSIGSLP
jgi:hypothetical protein